MTPSSDIALEKFMLSRELLYEFEKGLNPQKPAESKIPARIVGYGEISAIFEIEADKNHVYKRLPLFDSLVAARHYQQMYLDYCSLLVKAGLCLPDHDSRIVAVPGRPAALYIAQKKLPDANFGHKLIHHLDDGASLDLIEHVIREIVKIWNFNLDCLFRAAAPGPVFHHPAVAETLRIYPAGQNQTIRNPDVRHDCSHGKCHCWRHHAVWQKLRP